MRVLVDADACPVIHLIEELCRSRKIPVTLLCDTSHILNSDYSEVRMISAGADAVDFALVNLCHKGDLVVTQDYGVAAMALSRGALCIHPSGRVYTDANIDGLLNERHVHMKSRRTDSRHHLKGPKKRTAEDDVRFSDSFLALLTD